MRATLAAEVESFLRERGPATATAIGLGIRARRDDVDEVLAHDARFLRVPPPEGGSPRGRYFGLSELVLTAAEGITAPTTDNAFLLSVLADGRWHTLTEILSRSFADRGVGLTVHSRAAELRRAGHVIENETTRSSLVRSGFQRAGFSRAVSSYRLVARAGSPRVLADARDESVEAA